MKKIDKKTAKMLKDKLDGFCGANPLPAELSKASIVEELRGMTVPEVKKPKIITLRRAASLAAAFIILLGSITVFNLFGGSAGIKLAVDTLNGKSPASQSAEISNAKNYKEIQNIFKKLSKDATKRNTDYLNESAQDKSLDGAVADNNESAGYGVTTNQQHGETNVQVKGVDEPDVMKNDGKYLYTCSNNSEVNIYSLLPADNMKLVSTLQYGEKESGSEQANSLFIKDNLLVVFSTENIYSKLEETTASPGDAKTGSAGASSQGTGGSSGSGTNNVEPEKAADDSGNAATKEKVPADDNYYSKSCSVCTVYDISDRTAPKQVKRISQDGNFISARLIGNEFYVLSSYDVDVYMTSGLDDVCIPSFSVDGKSGTIPAKDISITKNPMPSYLIVCGVSLNDLKAEPNTKAVLGGGSAAYCNADSLFVSRSVYTDSNQTKGWGADIAVKYSGYSNTEIYRFSIGGGKVEFQCAGKIKGTVLNQFAMDEYNGYFRIATTQGQWGKVMSSNVYVLNDKLMVVGKVEKIAPKERIYAVRFIGETGYVVTFEQTDPLFVLDLKEPTAPKIAGELKLPGFSSYLHPISDTLLLGVGQNGDTDGTTPGIKLSLFDISDPAKPKEIDNYVIEGNSSTGAMDDHKAFMVYPEKGIFGLPVNRYINYKAYDAEESKDGSSSSSSSKGISSGTVSNGMVTSFNTYTVKDNKIVPVRSYEENSKLNGDSYDYYGGIIRGTYIGETLYTLSGTGLTSFSMYDGKLLDTLKISAPSQYYGYGIKEPMLAD